MLAPSTCPFSLAAGTAGGSSVAGELTSSAQDSTFGSSAGVILADSEGAAGASEAIVLVMSRPRNDQSSRGFRRNS